MIKLHSVKLHKTDTCLTYVLKRIGQYKQEKTYSLKKYNEYFDSEEIDDKTIFKKGDIILWNKRGYEQEFPTEITETGEIISNLIMRNIHIGIIENISESSDNFYSECTRNVNGFEGIPILKLRNINEKRRPDFILKFKLHNDGK